MLASIIPQEKSQTNLLQDSTVRANLLFHNYGDLVHEKLSLEY